MLFGLKEGYWYRKDAAKVVGRSFVDQRQLVEMEKTAVELAINVVHLLVIEIHSFPTFFLLLHSVLKYLIAAEIRINVVIYLLVNALCGSLNER